MHQYSSWKRNHGYSLCLCKVALIGSHSLNVYKDCDRFRVANYPDCTCWETSCSWGQMHAEIQCEYPTFLHFKKKKKREILIYISTQQRTKILVQFKEEQDLWEILIAFYISGFLCLFFICFPRNSFYFTNNNSLLLLFRTLG